MKTWSYGYRKSSSELISTHCTEVRFASFLFSGFTTMAVINSPENRLAKCTFVHWSLWKNKTENITPKQKRVETLVKSLSVALWMVREDTDTYIIKGGLISEGFLLWLKSLKENGVKSFCWALSLEEWFGTFLFWDLRPSEKHSEI